jgi:TolB-like protein/DNA-binding winged helix-turn-helix (wHTH) protein/Flp pilus assembly protein TadD
VDGARRLLLRHGDLLTLKPRVFDTLLYLARNPGRVIARDELMRAIWPDAFVEENNLAQNVSTLRRVLGENRGDNRYIVTVPGRGYRFVAEVKVARDGARNEVSAPHRGAKSRKRVLILGSITAALGVALAIGIWSQTKTRSLSLPAIRTIAVLPFKPLVAQAENESLEMGISDTLITRLSNIRQLTVRPLSAVRRYGGPEQDPFAAGRELGVQAVLDGHIQTWGDRIRVTTRLVSVGDGKQLWAGQFDENARDIFVLQDSISEKVTAELALKLTSDERELLAKRHTNDPQAYELYLKGRFFLNQSRLNSIMKAIEFFEEAIRKDPNYALAHSGLADCYRNLPITSDVPSGDAFPMAKKAAIRALEIDATLAEAHTALGWIRLWYEWDWEGAENAFQRALEINPNHLFARVGYAHLLSDQGRNESALEEAEHALTFDPISVPALTMKAHFLYQARLYPAAIENLRRALELEPNFWVGQITLGKIYEAAGRHDEALEAFQKAKDFSGGMSEPISLSGYTYAVSGRRQDAEGALRELKAISERKYVPPHYLALVYHGLGNETEALTWLERAYQERDVHMVFLGVDPKWDALRRDPRFLSIVKRMKLPTTDR